MIRNILMRQAPFIRLAFHGATQVLNDTVAIAVGNLMNTYTFMRARGVRFSGRRASW